MKKDAYMVPLEALKDLPYDKDAPIEQGAIVYKVNSGIEDLYEDGTLGVALSCMRNSKGTLNYLVAFKVSHIIAGVPEGIIPVQTLCEIDQDYISTTKPV